MNPVKETVKYFSSIYVLLSNFLYVVAPSIVFETVLAGYHHMTMAFKCKVLVSLGID